MRYSNCNICILLPFFNPGEFLITQICSIISQVSSYQLDIDLIFYDDGSTDSSLSLLNQFITNSSNYDKSNFSFAFKILSSDDYGRLGNPAKSFFFLLNYVSAFSYDFIFLSDHDDIWHPYKLDTYMSCFFSSKPDAISSDLLAFSDQGTNQKYIKKGPINVDSTKYVCDFDYLFQGASAGCTYAFNARSAALISSVISQYSSSDNHMPPNHDWLFYFLIRSRNLHWLHLDKSYVFYRIHGMNFYGTLTNRSSLFLKLRRLRLGWYRDMHTFLYDMAPDDKHRTILRQLTTYCGRLNLLVKLHKFRRDLYGRIGLFFILLLPFLYCNYDSNRS